MLGRSQNILLLKLVFEYLTFPRVVEVVSCLFPRIVGIENDSGLLARDASYVIVSILRNSL